MNKLSLIFYSLWLLPLLAISGLAEAHYLRFIDQDGKPIPDVAIDYSITAQFPAPNPGTRTGTQYSDANGRLTLPHPCGVSSGSCCAVQSEIRYAISKAGYQFSYTGGAVLCGCCNQRNIVVLGSVGAKPRFTTVSAASYQAQFAPEMITAGFGSNLAARTEVSSLSLQTTLADRKVVIISAQGEDVLAKLLFVSPQQINFLIPSTVYSGTVVFFVKDENQQVLSLNVAEVGHSAPGVFTANANGSGVPAAVIVRVKPGDVQTYEPVAQFDPATRRFTPLSLDLGPEDESLVLALFGTGWRNKPIYDPTYIRIGEITCPIEYLGKQPTLEGLDQLNVRLPRTLIGKGDVLVEVVVANKAANLVQLRFK